MVAGGGGLQPSASEKGDSATGPSPVDRARSGSKHHLLVDATGIPLAWAVPGGNRNDDTQLVPLVDRVPPVRGKVGRPRRRPDRVTADRGYDHDKYCRELRGRPEHHRRSLVARPSTAPDSVPWCGGSSSAPSPGCTPTNGCSYATTARHKSTKPSSHSPAASSVSGSCNRHSETTSKRRAVEAVCVSDAGRRGSRFQQ